MIKKILLENFKAFKKVEIEIKPLTIIVGPNSGGKTSLLQSICLIQQTLRGSSADVLKFSDIMNLGNFESILHQNSTTKEVRIRFDFDDGTFFDVIISKNEGVLDVKNFSCNTGKFEYILKNIKKIKQNDSTLEQEKSKLYLSEKCSFNLNNNFGTDILQNIELVFHRDNFLITPNLSPREVNSIKKHLENVKNKLDSNSLLLSNIRNELKVKQNELHERRDKLLELNDVNKKLNEIQTSVKELKNDLSANKDKLDYIESFTLLEKHSNDFNRKIKQKFESVAYVGPIRAAANRSYELGHFDNVGFKGEHSVPIIEENNDLRNQLIKSLTELDIATSVETSTKGTSKNFELKLKTKITNSTVNFADVGCGTSQIIPILVQLLLSKGNSMIIIEQPEVHLHPKIQADFATFLIDSIKNNTKFLIETHSEYFVERTRTCIMRNPELADYIIIYYVEQNKEEKQSKIIPITINSEGQYDYLPEEYLTNMRVKEIDDQLSITFNKLKKMAERENEDF